MRRSLIALAGAVLLGACAAQPRPPVAEPTASASPSASGPGSLLASPSAPGLPGRADELGVVPVLMYHQIRAAPGRDDVTPAQFRAELRALYDEGYRPVTAADLVGRRIDVPAGTHPVVLTFDDSTVSQAQIGPDGGPDPDTALGILEAFGAAHPDFAPTATFYVNTSPEPFADAAVLPWLAAHGYEIGAHGHTHASLRRLSAARVQEELGANVAAIRAAAPGYEVTTMALPEGVRPADPELAYRGAHAGVRYAFTGVMGVDEIAAASPYAARFNARYVPRVGTGDLVALLASLRKNPGRLFTSDGDPGVVSFPSARRGELAPEFADRARPS